MNEEIEVIPVKEIRHFNCEVKVVEEGDLTTEYFNILKNELTIGDSEILVIRLLDMLSVATNIPYNTILENLNRKPQETTTYDIA